MSSPSPSRWLTWANLVTSLRLALIPATYLSITFSDWALAAVLFTIVVLSDVIDGRIARKFNEASPLGGLLDHATDATFVAICTAAIASSGQINAWLAPLIAITFIQYTLDSKTLQGQTLRASKIGRLNGIAYFVLVGTVIGHHVLGFYFLDIPIQAFAWILVVSSLISIVDRLDGLRRLRA